jgi:Flp pilus assembly protein TadG
MRCRWARSDRGAESIEVALALPIVLIVLFTGLEYGWLMLRTVQLDHAARIGAREAALSGSLALDVEGRVDAALRRSGIAGAAITVTPSDLTSLPPGTEVRVDIEVDYANVGLVGLGSFMPLPESLKASSSMVREPDS